MHGCTSIHALIAVRYTSCNAISGVPPTEYREFGGGGCSQLFSSLNSLDVGFESSLMLTYPLYVRS